MKIIIVGCGKVGYTLAEQLSRENHYITVVDNDSEALRRAGSRLDVMTLHGNGIQGSVLREAGVAQSDLVIAATSGDEMNMVCALTAKKLGAGYTVARIRDPEYARDITLLKKELGINMVINPEQATASEISRILRFPGATNIELFVRGRVEMVGFAAAEDDMILGTRLSVLRRRISGSVLFCACKRGEDVFIPDGNTVFEPGDHIHVIGEPVDISNFFKTLGRNTSRVREIMIVGGGRIGRYLTEYMTKMGARVKIIEINPAVCQMLSETDLEADVIQGDGTDIEILEGENITACDAFVTLTGHDEYNLMTALLALQYGVPRVVAKSSRQNYNSVVKSLGLDSVISPKTITANQIIHLVRGMQNSEGSVMETLYRLLDDRVEAMEFTLAHDTPHLGKPLKSIRLQKGILIAVIVRRGRIIIPGGDDHMEENDSVILVASQHSLSGFNDIYDD